MKLLGAQPSLWQRALPWIVALGVFVLLAAATVWVRQQDAARRVAEARADTAEAQLAAAQASLAAVSRSVAVASATAAAQANDPAESLKRALGIAFAAYQDPSEAHLRAVADAFSPAARAVFQTEAEHLISGGRHLGGQSSFDVQVLSTAPKGTDRVEVKTRETWVYDERDQSNRPTRCVREEGAQTYTMRKTGVSWIVEDVELGASRRSDC